MSKKDWSKLIENGGPDHYACVDGRIDIDEETVVLYSRQEPNKIGYVYRSGNYSKIVKAEWRQSKSYGKFVYILHEDKSSEYYGQGQGLIATPESGIITEDYAQPEDYQNFPESNPTRSKGQKEEKKRENLDEKQGCFGPIAKMIKKVKKIAKILFWIIAGLLLLGTIFVSMNK